MRKILIPISIVLSLWLSACTIYKPDIRQGNELEDKDFQRLKAGMSKREVIFVMGSPSLQDPFHKNRWDYVRTLKKSDEDMVRKHLVLYFENDTLMRIDDSALNETSIK